MLSVRGLCTEFHGDNGHTVQAARDVSFEVPQGKLFTLLGPSGCGKTTTLRSIAGLERPSAGEIAVSGRVVYSAAAGTFVPPARRHFGMVFQSYAIWPHMTVFRNAAFPLEVRRGRGRAAIREKVMRVLAVVGLDALADRPATKLSGGQQQRLALARALVMEPPLLLLDEPLSNLDAKLRGRMRLELKRLQRELGLTTVYVTHDQTEALALSHRIAVMNDGRIVQTGTPREIYERPRDAFVADFVGSTNLIAGVVAAANAPNEVNVTTSFGTLRVAAADGPPAGTSITVALRPEDMQLSESRPEGPNVCAGLVRERVFLGEAVELEIEAGNQILLARAHPSLRTPVGARIYWQSPPEKCIAL